MPYVLGSNEGADRARRALGTRGKTPFELDDRIVPTVLLQDLTRAPWRRSGRQYIASQLNTGANFIGVVLRNDSPFDIVLDRIIIAEAGGVTFNSVACGPRGDDPSLFVLTGVAQARYTEQMGDRANNYEFLPVSIGQYTNAASQIVVADFGYNVAVANEVKDWPGLGIVIPGRKGITTHHYLVERPGGADFRASFFGTFYDDLPVQAL